MGAPSAQVQSPQSSSFGKGTGNQITDQVNSSYDPQNSPQPSIGKGSNMGASMQGFQANQQYEAPEKMQGAQGAVTFPSQGGQPEMGMPNAYSNTIQNGQNLLDSQGSWDNSPKSMGGGTGSSGSSGKGKGA